MSRMVLLASDWLVACLIGGRISEFSWDRNAHQHEQTRLSARGLRAADRARKPHE
jgi:hypothetical protein